MKNIIILSCLLLISIETAHAQSDRQKESALQYDMQGTVQYSQYNFTDIKSEYKDIDGCGEFKSSYWLDDNRLLAPFISVIGASTTEDDFWWQKNMQLNIGLQWYPIKYLNLKHNSLDREDEYSLYRSIRLFSIFSYRNFYDEPESSNTKSNDFQIGLDHYYDNLDAQAVENSYSILTYIVAGYKNTNFVEADYNTIYLAGNIKFGPTFTPFNTILIPYAVADWSYVPEYEERWWENFLRIGVGIKWYPFLINKKDKSDLFNDLFKRFNIYMEIPHNLAWLGDSPTNDIKETDFKIGISFSTGGYLNKN